MTSYHHGNLRAALVGEGLALARTRGPDGVVLREVARRVGVSHNAAYRHFADRTELLAEISALAMDRLVEAMQGRLDQVEGTPDAVAVQRARLRAIGQAYVEFALAEPGLFKVAFDGAVTGAPEEHSASDRPESTGPFGLLNLTLDGLVDVGYLAASGRAGADIACWAGVHGFAVLHLDGPLASVPAAIRGAALDQLLTLLDLGLGVRGRPATPGRAVMN